MCKTEYFKPLENILKESYLNFFFHKDYFQISALELTNGQTEELDSSQLIVAHARITGLGLPAKQLRLRYALSSLFRQAATTLRTESPSGFIPHY